MQGKALFRRGLAVLLVTLPVTLNAAPGDPTSPPPQAEEQFQHQQQQQKARDARPPPRHIWYFRKRAPASPFAALR